MSIDTTYLEEDSVFYPFTPAGMLDTGKKAIDAICDLWSRYKPAVSPDPHLLLRLRSTNFEIEGNRLNFGAIGGIAGINTDLSPEKAYAQFVHTLANNTHIHWTHNQSHGAPIDVLETYFLNYHGFSGPAKLLKKNWKKFHKLHKDNEGAKFLQICYSQGASHVRNALENCPYSLRNRVIVLALAPAEVVPSYLCYFSANYASRRDGVYYGKLLSDPTRIVENIENLKELQILEPAADAPLFDHSFQSPTFAQILEQTVANFLKTYG